MSVGCSVCHAPELERIDEALRQGVSLRSLEGTYHVSRSALSRHLSHLEGGVSPPPDEPAPAAAATAGPLPRVPTRVRNCEVCQLPEAALAAIETALAASGPTTDLPLTAGLPLAAFVFHRDHRAREAEANARYDWEQDRLHADGPSDLPPPLVPAGSVPPALDWHGLMAQAALLHAQAQYASSLPTMLPCLRNLTALLPYVLEAIAAQAGVVCPVPPGHLPPKFPPPGQGMPARPDWMLVGRDEAFATEAR
jgi:hypothetical protein